MHIIAKALSEQLLQAAKASGTPRIVFLSSISAAEPDTLLVGKLHLEKEDVIRASGLPSAFLRPGFMSNTFGWLPTIKSESTVFNPMGSGQYAPIAPEDIAAAAVHTLRSPRLSGDVYNLTGAQLINTPQQVEILSRLMHRPLRIVDLSAQVSGCRSDTGFSRKLRRRVAWTRLLEAAVVPQSQDYGRRGMGKCCSRTPNSVSLPCEPEHARFVP